MCSRVCGIGPSAADTTRIAPSICAARLLLRRLVDLVVRRELRLALLRQYLGDRRRQRRLAVVHVTNRPDVAMRLRPRESLFGHEPLRSAPSCPNDQAYFA